MDGWGGNMDGRSRQGNKAASAFTSRTLRASSRFMDDYEEEPTVPEQTAKIARLSFRQRIEALEKGVAADGLATSAAAIEAKEPSPPESEALSTPAALFEPGPTGATPRTDRSTDYNGGSSGEATPCTPRSHSEFSEQPTPFKKDATPLEAAVVGALQETGDERPGTAASLDGSIVNEEVEHRVHELRNSHAAYMQALYDSIDDRERSDLEEEEEESLGWDGIERPSIQRQHRAESNDGQSVRYSGGRSEDSGEHSERVQADAAAPPPRAPSAKYYSEFSPSRPTAGEQLRSGGFRSRRAAGDRGAAGAASATPVSTASSAFARARSSTRPSGKYYDSPFREDLLERGSTRSLGSMTAARQLNLHGGSVAAPALSVSGSEAAQQAFVLRKLHVADYAGPRPVSRSSSAGVGAAGEVGTEGQAGEEAEGEGGAHRPRRRVAAVLLVLVAGAVSAWLWRNEDAQAVVQRSSRRARRRAANAGRVAARAVRAAGAGMREVAVHAGPIGRAAAAAAGTSAAAVGAAAASVWTATQYTAAQAGPVGRAAAGAAGTAAAHLGTAAMHACAAVQRVSRHTVPAVRVAGAAVSSAAQGTGGVVHDMAERLRGSKSAGQLPPCGLNLAHHSSRNPDGLYPEMRQRLSPRQPALG